jgi:hypothetical protein
MASKGSKLQVEQLMRENDYLQSENGVFIAYLHVDGNLCIYPGWPERDKFIWQSHARSQIGPHCACLHKDGNLCIYPGEHPEYGKFIWQSHNRSGVGTHCLCLQNDGSLCIYDGTEPGGNPIWTSGVTDPIEDIDEVSKIDYDLNASTILSSNTVELYKQTVTNNSLQTQSSSISGSKTVSETYAWSETTGLKLAAKVTYDAKIPVVGGGKVELSAEVSETVTFSGSKAVQKAWGFNTPVITSPNTAITAYIMVKTSKISVPYTLTGKVRLKGGQIVPVTLRGTFIGENSHDLEVRFEQVQCETKESISWKQTLPQVSNWVGQ